MYDCCHCCRGRGGLNRNDSMADLDLEHAKNVDLLGVYPVEITRLGMMIWSLLDD